jgi:hypothetical protein
VTFDISRFTFDPWKNFSRVVMEQGRVQLDSDWNERDAELSRRIQAGTLDIMGHAVYPPTTPAAFQITPATDSSGQTAVLIGCGRMYVDGLLAENHGWHKNAHWDPALAERSGAPQPPVQPLPPATEKNSVDFVHQPHLPGAALPKGPGPYLFYLDVWNRPVTYLEDHDLIDKAVGVDTSGRLQTVWQVKWMAVPAGSTCATPITFPPSSAGRLTTNVVPNPTAGPCCLTTGNGYTGIENQCYRVQIHQGGTGSDPASTTGATFKFSRENGSVASAVTAIASGTNTVGNPASVLTVTSLGRDQVLGFHPGDWIEILDNWTELSGMSGTLCQIDSISVPNKTITLTATVPTGSTAAGNFPVDSNGLTSPHRCTRIIRWDQSGTVYQLNGTQLTPWCDLATTGGAIPVPDPNTVLVLESGITVLFSLDPAGAGFNVGDFWIFDARTADGSVEILDEAPPVGIHHHYANLAIVNLGSPPNATDCRTPFSCAGECDCGCCVVTVGVGGKYASINQAIAALPDEGGEVCILPGRYHERVIIVGRKDVVIRGCGPHTRVVSPETHTHGIGRSRLSAVITVVGSQHVRLWSFAVEAAEGDVGILLDSPAAGGAARFQAYGNTDITIEDMVIAGSNLPAVAAIDVNGLKIAGSRIAVMDMSGLWPSIYARGAEMLIEHNWIGLQDSADALTLIPAVVAADLSLAARTRVGKANGGIQIAGSSHDVLICDNDIEDGVRSGITLGSFVLLDATGTDTGAVTAFAPFPSGGPSLLLPPMASSGNITGKVAAGPGLTNIRIARNRIRNTGLCGIGPVGFFDPKTAVEAISIENLAILDNVISTTMQDIIVPPREQDPIVGYGAVCLPDVQNLLVRDNVITDFGNVPGAQVCGIYVLMAELAEISGNQIRETRDWSHGLSNHPFVARAVQAGIWIAAIPPAWKQTAVGPGLAAAEISAVETPSFQPGMPALRVENNVVRLPLGPALDATGYGPFSILGNHFTSGGRLPAHDDPTASDQGALTVRILNVGTAIDPPPTRFGFLHYFKEKPVHPEAPSRALTVGSSGAVLFANNICQLETRANGARRLPVLILTSVLILTHDHLIFSNNHCWLDSAWERGMSLDALLVAESLNVCGNRFQESRNSVYASGLTYGRWNITAQNISTHCLFVRPAGSTPVIDTANLEMLCPK